MQLTTKFNRGDIVYGCRVSGATYVEVLGPAEIIVIYASVEATQIVHYILAGWGEFKEESLFTSKEEAQQVADGINKKFEPHNNFMRQLK